MDCRLWTKPLPERDIADNKFYGQNNSTWIAEEIEADEPIV